MSKASPFVTGTQLAILRVLSSKRGKYGLEIAREAKLVSGTVYTLLDRLTDRGLVRYKRPHAWDHSGIARPLYTLTEDGERMIRAADMVTG